MNSNKIKISKEIIKKCKSLEKELSEYKLGADLIPKKNFFKNLRTAFPKSEWEIIRNKAYKKSNYKCSICGIKNIGLEAHENWKYEYQQSIQKLISVNVLCSMCHRNIHMGKSLIDIKQGKLNSKEFISHWAKINDVDKRLFNEYKKKVEELWKLKNEFTWEIIDNKGINIYEEASLSNVLESITDDYEN